MLTAAVTITIPGEPATKGSMKCIGRAGKRGHVLVEDHKSSDPWRATVVGWLKRRWPVERRAVASQPLGAEVSFTLPRPKAHFGTGRNAHTLKPQYVAAWPVGHNTGDVDKLLRLVLDALQDADVIPDDCAVIEATERKVYAGDNRLPDSLPWPGVVIRLFPMEGLT